MLHLIPPPLHRVALRLADGLRKRWWRLRKPLLLGCRVIAFDEAGRVMLIRHSYGSNLWMLPGGGIGRGEDPVAAAVREFCEETGCTLIAARLVTITEDPLHGATNRVHVVCGQAKGAPKPDGREIVALGFHAPDDLPEDISPTLAARIGSWLELTSSLE
ncbi:NUDIX domain-containing protein [Novosphingobium sp.]|uniref:NUDIX domain-containing protein n=1 Tax=Novosphingobium sp. TaxID=1874826 RepID=UPI0035AEB570